MENNIMVKTGCKFIEVLNPQGYYPGSQYSMSKAGGTIHKIEDTYK